MNLLNSTFHGALDAATADLDPPFAVIDLDAFDANAADLLRRGGGVPLRLASKSLRVRTLQDRALAAGFRGTLCFTLPEALWLAALGGDDLVVAYPTVDRGALRELAHSSARERVTVMVDCREHLDAIRAANPAGPVKICIDVDAAWRVGCSDDRGETLAAARPVPGGGPRARGRGPAGTRAGRDHGLRGPDRRRRRPPAGQATDGARAARAAGAVSARELAVRRAAIVDAVRGVAPLRFVNGGGTGSIERTAAEPAVTEVAAGSGLYGPTLFDAYRAFTPRPAALFALPIVRKPTPKIATALGGGYPASGAFGRDRLPRPVLPLGLKLDAREGAGEVQTPLLGRAAAALQVGDRVWFRHAKAGELCERFDAVHLIRGGKLVDTVPTYRGEGKTFL